MPSLEDILKKTKAKSEQINIVRKPVAIAEADRPYTDAPVEQMDSLPPLSQQNFVNENSTQSQHKLNTNLTQTECNKPKLNTNSTQTKHEVSTNQIQSAHKTKLNTKLIQTKHKSHANLDIKTKHKLNTNLTQSEHISDVIGVQRTILLFIFTECKKSGSYVTEPLKLVNIASHLKVASGSIKTSILRLCKKNLLKINYFKNGRGGWSVYEIPGSIYDELLNIETKHKLNTN